MVHIISKRDGPRREDIAAKSFIEKNRATIDSLAEHLTGGRWRELQNRAPMPAAETSRTSLSAPRGRPRETRPHVRISPNDRVVIMDLASGRQLHHLGDLRGSGGARHLALATRRNGFFAPLDDRLAEALADLDGIVLPGGSSEERLKQVIAERLGFVSAEEGAG